MTFSTSGPTSTSTTPSSPRPEPPVPPLGHRILGLDPGSAALGWGVVERRDGTWKMAACGVLRAPRREALAERLHCLHSGLLSLLDRWQPREAAVEDLFYARNARAALVLGQARGVALLALCQRGLRPVSYSPLSVKQAVTGSGAADKEQVRRWVCRWLETTARDIEIDASDALAVALCHARSRRWRSLESAAPLPRPRRRPADTAGRSASARASAGERRPAGGRTAQRSRALPR